MDAETYALMDGKLHVYRRENSRFWQCSTYLGGFNHRTSTKEESLVAAKDFARGWYMERCVDERRRQRGGEPDGAEQPTTTNVIVPFDRRRRRKHAGPLFKEAAETFLKEYRVITEGERNKDYVDQKADHIRVHLLPFFGEKTLPEITAGLIQEYRVHRQTSCLNPLHTNVAEVQRWRERFAEIARDHGIDVDATRAWERGKAPARSRGLVRHGAPRPARWTREQVRRGLAARKQRLLSEAALATARSDGERAATLRAKAARLRMRADDKLVRHTAAERRRHAPQTAWESARARNAADVAKDFRDQAYGLFATARATTDEQRRALLERAATQLWDYADGIRPMPTRAQKVASQMQRTRVQNSSAEPDRER